MLERVPRRTVLGVSGAGITTFVLPGAALAASFEGTTLGSTGPDLLAISTADAGDGTHDVVLTVTLTDSGGDPYPDAARVDMTVGDDQGDPTSTTVDGEATGTASKLATTGTVTFAVAFPSYGDHQFTVATTPAAASHPSGITLLYTHSGLPGAPTSPSGTAGDGQVALTWTAPDDTGGLTLDRYETRYSSDDGSTWSSWATTGSITTAVTVTGLDNGTGYVFQVRAVNANGAGDASTSTTTLTPTGTPGAPTSVAGTPGDEQVALTWSAPIDDGGLTISRYETRYSSDSGSNWSAWTTTGSSSVSATVTGLTNGTAYVFQVRAANDNGTGDASTTSTAVTPRTTPAAPTITGITAGNEELSVAFTAGSDNGESIDNYEYELDASGTWTALSPADTTSPLTITGLTNETTYAVRIRAVNAAGGGTASNSVDGTPGFTDPTSTLATVATYLRNRMSDLRNPSFFSYALDGNEYYIGDGGNDMYDGGNYTAPALRSGATYSSSGSIPTPPALSYAQTSVATSDTDFHYVSLGYGTSPDRRPLTMLGVRTTAGQPTGFQKSGNLGADNSGSINYGYLHQGATVAGFTVYAYYRQTYGQGADPSVCDLYLLFGHSTWGSSFGTVSASRATNTDANFAQLSASGAGVANLMAATLLLSRPNPTPIPTSDMTAVISRMLGHVRDALGL